MNITEFLTRLRGVKRSGIASQARCPADDDGTASLSVAEGEDSRILVHCHAGCHPEAILATMGLKLADLNPQRAARQNAPRGRIVAAYDYTDEGGTLLFQCVRYAPKAFRQRCPNPAKPGKWIWNLKGVRRVLYRLPELKAPIAAGQTIFIAEGEKDCDMLAITGFIATRNPTFMRPK